MKNQDLNLKNIGPQFAALGPKLARYAPIFFFVLIAGVYGFVLMRINTLASIEPNPEDVDSQVKASSVQKIDQRVARQLESMKDNSVNVQTLFDKARENPFRE